MPLLYTKSLDKCLILDGSGFSFTMGELAAVRPTYPALEIPDNADSAYYDPVAGTSYLSNGNKHLPWPTSWPAADQILGDGALSADVTAAREATAAAALAAQNEAEAAKVATDPPPS